MQIICTDNYQNTVSISVLFSISEEDNPLLAHLGFGIYNPIFALKLRNGEILNLIQGHAKYLNLGQYLNNFNHYISYVGSLTTPPCTQNVKWFVLLKKMTISKKQLDFFPILFGRKTNIRGLQNNENDLKII